ncbi:MAG: hypothetical protein MI861_10140, partial [Pirellulales bacterium]|nr:hypothetical protein [Pirellulales bacterium]
MKASPVSTRREPTLAEFPSSGVGRTGSSPLAGSSRRTTRREVATLSRSELATAARAREIAESDEIDDLVPRVPRRKIEPAKPQVAEVVQKKASQETVAKPEQAPSVEKTPLPKPSQAELTSQPGSQDQTDTAIAALTPGHAAQEASPAPTAKVGTPQSTLAPPQAKVAPGYTKPTDPTEMATLPKPKA